MPIAFYATQCCCGGAKSPALIRAELSFGRQELLYDVANNCWAEAHTMGEGQAAEARHLAEDAAQDGNADRIARQLELRHAIARESLYAWSKQLLAGAEEPVELSDRIEDPESYRIPLLVPEDASMTTLELLEKCVHEYMASWATADWLGVAKPESAQAWAAKAEAALAQAKSCLTRRSQGKGLRRKLSPF